MVQVSGGAQRYFHSNLLADLYAGGQAQFTKKQKDKQSPVFMFWCTEEDLNLHVRNGH